MGEYSSGALGASAITQMFSSVGSSYAQSSALKAKGAYDASIAEANRKVSDYAAEDALKRGDKAAMEHGKAVRSLIGKQRANFAAQGIDVGSGSAADFQNESEFLGSLDALTIKNNAAREAFGYRTQSINYASQAKFARLAASNQATTTLLTGGLNALGYGTRAGYYLGGGSAFKKED